MFVDRILALGEFTLVSKVIQVDDNGYISQEVWSIVHEPTDFFKVVVQIIIFMTDDPLDSIFRSSHTFLVDYISSDGFCWV